MRMVGEKYTMRTMWSALTMRTTGRDDRVQPQGHRPCAVSRCLTMHNIRVSSLAWERPCILSTLHASDSFAKPFKIFVQIWLCEKLNLLEDVDWNWVYTPQRISTSDLRHPDLPEHMWRETMADIGIHSIVWRGYGLDIEYSAVQTAGFYRMVIPGMKSFTFYIPMRTLRQLGVNQEVPADDSVIFELPGFNVRTLQHF